MVHSGINIGYDDVPFCIMNHHNLLLLATTPSSSFSSPYPEPPEIVTRLPPYTVTRKEDRVTLGIEFQGYPLSSSGVQWRVNGEELPKSLSADTETSSLLFLSGDSLELEDIVTATVNVFGNSTASTATTVVVIRKYIHTCELAGNMHSREYT